MQTSQGTKHPEYFLREQGKQMPIRRLLCQIHLHFHRKRPRTQSQNRCTFIVSPPQGSTHKGTKQLRYEHLIKTLIFNVGAATENVFGHMGCIRHI